jgi:hypothetical protein
VEYLQDETLFQTTERNFRISVNVAYLREDLVKNVPSIFMDVAMWEHRTFDSEAFRYGKVY